MKTEIFHCDRCGTTAEEDINGDLPEGWWVIEWPFASEDSDLCPTCWRDLRSWVDTTPKYLTEKVAP